MAKSGFPTIVEGIVGPWMVDLMLAEASAAAVQLHYVVLRPTRDVALDRALSREGEERVPGHPALTDPEPIRQLWHEFSDLGSFEAHVVDNTGLGAEQAAQQVCSLISHGLAAVQAAHAEHVAETAPPRDRAATATRSSRPVTGAHSISDPRGCGSDAPRLWVRCRYFVLRSTSHEDLRDDPRYRRFRRSRLGRDSCQRPAADCHRHVRDGPLHPCSPGLRHRGVGVLGPPKSSADPS